MASQSPHSAAEAALSRRCALMRRLIRMHGPCGLVPETRRSPYEALVSAVAHQQLHANAAEAILRRFRSLHPGVKFPKPEHVLDTTDELLRSAGFSNGKILAIRDIAAKTQSGLVPTRAMATRMSDDELIERLTAVRGVGRWTVEMLLIFTLGRLDVLPVDDYGVRAGFLRHARGRDGITPRELKAVGERWAPYRSVASWYLWRAAEA